MSSQGWFESDEDYRKRIAREADERTIKDSTGDAPRQGWFESDDDYRERISREATEHIIENSTGDAPRQGWFESDSDYRERIHQEANERIVEDSTGSAPRRGWFESSDDYETRIRREANEHIIERDSGSAPKRRWFEGEHEYRSRIAHEAREIRAREHSESTSSGEPIYSSSYSSSASSSYGSAGGGGFVALIVLALVVSGIVAIKNLLDTRDNSNISYYVRVQSDVLNVRPTPSTREAPVTSLDRGTKVIVLEETEGERQYGPWARIQFEEGGRQMTGWVSTLYLAREGEASAEPGSIGGSTDYEPVRPSHGAMVSTTSVMVRHRPSVESSHFATLSHSDVLTVFDDTSVDGPYGPWMMVELESGETGWVSSQCVSKGIGLLNPLSRPCPADVAAGGDDRSGAQKLLDQVWGER